MELLVYLQNIRNIDIMGKDNMIYLLTLKFDPFADGHAKFSASSKATEDVRNILKEKFFVRERIFTRRFRNKLIGSVEFVLKFYFLCLSIPKGSVVIVQYPMVNISVFTKVLFLLKRFTTIAIIHDLQTYRFENQKEKRMLEIEALNEFNFVIVHSTKMQQQLVCDGVTSKMYVLNIFDYLLHSESRITQKKNSIVFAGALHKSDYLQDLHKIGGHENYRFHLYGMVKPNIDYSSFIKYKGAFSPNDVHSIEGEWGLLWDGNSIYDCTGNFGDYLQLIAPHKFSLYLACGLKTIVWEHSAMADIVRKNKLGITIASLDEIYEKIKELDLVRRRCGTRCSARHPASRSDLADDSAASDPSD